MSPINTTDSSRPYCLSLFINANNPNVALAAIDDIISMVDVSTQEFSSDNFIQPGDLPLVIRGSTKDQDEQCDYTFSIWPNQNYSAAIPIKPSPRFAPGSFIRHIDTGQQLIVRASIYYHISRRWYFACAARRQPASVYQYPTEELIFEVQWTTLLKQLSVATKCEWILNDKTGMLESGTNKSRKMNINDAHNTIKMWLNNEETPF